MVRNGQRQSCKVDQADCTKTEPGVSITKEEGTLLSRRVTMAVCLSLLCH